jgi:hypothetical protein
MSKETSSEAFGCFTFFAVLFFFLSLMIAQCHSDDMNSRFDKIERQLEEVIRTQKECRRF